MWDERRSALRLAATRSLRRLMLLALLVPFGAAHAAPFRDLYVVTVPADPSAADPRAAATRAALERLLVRVTGSRTAPQDPQLQRLLADPAPFVKGYGTDREGRPRVEFNPTRLDQALNELNLPVLGPERPLTLLWIAVDDGKGARALLPANELPADLTPEMAAQLTAIRSEITAVADERGVPIALPLLDLEDLNAVTFADVWGGFDDRILLASARYRADAVLVGRVHPGVSGTEVDWLLLKDTQRQPIAGLAVRDGLDSAADRYASELGTVGPGSTTRLTVLDVATSAEYGRVMRYLENLSALQTVDVESLDHGVLTLRVSARGDARVLERVLALGGVLRQDAPVSTGSQGGRPLVFRIANGGAPR